jgi:hypothetical protein
MIGYTEDTKLEISYTYGVWALSNFKTVPRLLY